MGQHHAAPRKAQLQCRAARLFGKVQPTCQIARLHPIARAAAPVKKPRGRRQHMIGRIGNFNHMPVGPLGQGRCCAQKAQMMKRPAQRGLG